MHELQETIKDKEDCIKEHDFEAAKQLLDHEMEVRTHIRIMKQSALTSEARGLVVEMLIWLLKLMYQMLFQIGQVFQ
jgi:hypothetical protein